MTTRVLLAVLSLSISALCVFRPLDESMVLAETAALLSGYCPGQKLDQAGVGAKPCLTMDLWLPLVSGCKRRVPKGLLAQGAHGATCSHLQDP